MSATVCTKRKLWHETSVKDHSSKFHKRQVLMYISNKLNSEGRVIADDTQIYRMIYESLGLDQHSPASMISAEQFLKSFMEARGYNFCKTPALQSPLNRPIKPRERESYNKDVLDTIQANDISLLRDRCRRKLPVLVCNRYGESTLHMAARRSLYRVVQIIMKTEGSPIIMDDYGRSALVDAMWAESPNFAIIEQLLDYNIDLLLLTDERGFTPLSYIRKDQIFKLCLFFYSRRDKYWPIKVHNKDETI